MEGLISQHADKNAREGAGGQMRTQPIFTSCSDRTGLISAQECSLVLFSGVVSASKFLFGVLLNCTLCFELHSHKGALPTCA